MTKTDERIKFLKICLKRGMSRKEAAQALSKSDKRIAPTSAQTMVYTNFNGPEYSVQKQAARKKAYDKRMTKKTGTEPKTTAKAKASVKPKRTVTKAEKSIVPKRALARERARTGEFNPVVEKTAPKKTATKEATRVPKKAPFQEEAEAEVKGKTSRGPIVDLKKPDTGKESIEQLVKKHVKKKKVKPGEKLIF